MIALYPGAFKPPHKGHFQVVKSLLDGSYNGGAYDKDNYKEKGAEFLKNNSGNKPKITQVIVFAGGGERNGITKEESKAIWDIYAKYIPNLIVMDGGDNPMFAAKNYAKENSDTEYFAVTGIRGEKDFVDLRRITTFSNTPNVKGLAISNPGFMQRASDLRNLILNNDIENVREFLPDEINDKEFKLIIKMLQDNIVAEVLAENIDGFIDTYFDTEKIGEGQYRMRPNRLSKTGHISSKDRSKLDFLYNYLSRLLPSHADINHNKDYITVKMKTIQEESEGPELKHFIVSLTDYMLDIGMNITPLPDIIVKKDSANASNFFGRTAYYSPSESKIVLYTVGRHNKDIVRSYAHEMIHHIQNLEGRLHDVQTQNTNSDPKLEELEKEAYTLGNITFRNWEDSLKGTNESLWANINAKKKSGKKSSHKNSNAYKAAKKAGTALKKSKNEVVFSIDELAEDLIKLIKKPKK